MSKSSNTSSSCLQLGLHSAAASGNIGLVKFALDYGQSTESLHKGLLPIHIAAASGHSHVVKYLIDRGCNVNGIRRPRRLSGKAAPNSTSEISIGATALHFAVASNSLDIVNILLESGANPHIVDKYGSTPFCIARAKNFTAIESQLETYAALHSAPVSTNTSRWSTISSNDSSILIDKLNGSTLTLPCTPTHNSKIAEKRKSIPQPLDLTITTAQSQPLSSPPLSAKLKSPFKKLLGMGKNSKKSNSKSNTTISRSSSTCSKSSIPPSSCKFLFTSFLSPRQDLSIR
jgi:hypothetical protein